MVAKRPAYEEGHCALIGILTTTNGKPISMAINALFGFQTDIGLVMAVTVASMVPGAVLLFAMRSHLSRGFKIGQV
jgi:glycerol transport system permease protein